MDGTQHIAFKPKDGVVLPCRFVSVARVECFVQGVHLSYMNHWMHHA